MPLDVSPPDHPVVAPAAPAPLRRAMARVALALGVAITMLAVLWYSPFARGLREDRAQPRQECEVSYARYLQWSLDNPGADAFTVRADGSDRDTFIASCLAETMDGAG